MSGRRIDDYGSYPHTSDMSMKSTNKVTHEKSAVGAGYLDAKYPDTTEDVLRDQNRGINKAEGHQIIPGNRY